MATTSEKIISWYKINQESGHRPHLGASLIGESCERKLWLTFRWAKAQDWEGRMLRLFNDGHRAEARFVHELKSIGCEVWDRDPESGDQFRVSAIGGHFGGSCDAVVQGVPENPSKPHIAEFKTSNDKLFQQMVKKGVKDAKPMHHAQMQVYMGLMEIEQAIYLVENKNDSAVYSEIINFDQREFDRLIAKARRIITSTTPPPRIGDASTLDCKWCNFSSLCHGSDIAEVNCRTCANSTPEMDGQARWSCNENRTADPSKGCAQHLYIPALLEALGEPIDGGTDYVIYRDKAGAEFVNGPSPNFSSAEIRTGQHLVKDAVVQEIKQEIKTAKLTASAFDDMQSDDLDAVPVKKERKGK